MSEQISVVDKARAYAIGATDPGYGETRNMVRDLLIELSNAERELDRLRPAPATEGTDGWEVKDYDQHRHIGNADHRFYVQRGIDIMTPSGIVDMLVWSTNGDDTAMLFESESAALAALAKWREGEKKPTLEGEFAICNPTVPQLTIYRLNNVKSLRSSGYEYWSDNELRWVGKVKGDGTFDRLAVADEVPDSIPIEEVPPRLRDDVACIRSERKAKAEAKPTPHEPVEGVELRSFYWHGISVAPSIYVDDEVAGFITLETGLIKDGGSELDIPNTNKDALKFIPQLTAFRDRIRAERKPETKPTPFTSEEEARIREIAREAKMEGKWSLEVL